MFAAASEAKEGGMPLAIHDDDLHLKKLYARARGLFDSDEI